MCERVSSIAQVNSMLLLARFGDDEGEVGIQKMQACDAYTGAYPPHDGLWQMPKRGENVGRFGR